MAGGCSDDDLVRLALVSAVGGSDPPARHFSNEVAAGADAAPDAEGGGSAVAVAGDVVDVANRRVTERVTAGLVAQADEFGQPSVEVAPSGVAADNRAAPI